MANIKINGRGRHAASAREEVEERKACANIVGTRCSFITL